MNAIGWFTLIEICAKSRAHSEKLRSKSETSYFWIALCKANDRSKLNRQYAVPGHETQKKILHADHFPSQRAAAGIVLYWHDLYGSAN